MTARFVLDESSWAATNGAIPGVLSNAIQRLIERLDVARDRGEDVVKHADYYKIDLGDGMQLFSLLFELGCRVQLEHDLAEQLRLALDRVNEFDDSELIECDAEFEGKIRFAPGVVWAHTSCSEGHHIAVLPLPLGEVAIGRLPVTVAGATLEIVFVTGESQHVGFFRSVIALENANEAKFENLARSAFPALEWADNIWRGLGDFSRPYIEVRDRLVDCLGGLSDHGAGCFHEHRAGDPRHLTNVLSIQVGAKTADENGPTKQHPPSRRDRTRHHRGIDKVFYWHVKLRPNVDRIYFRYEPRSVSLPLPEHGRIVVGLFKDHCVLPN